MPACLQLSAATWSAAPTSTGHIHHTAGARLHLKDWCCATTGLTSAPDWLAACAVASTVAEKHVDETHNALVLTEWSSHGARPEYADAGLT